MTPAEAYAQKMKEAQAATPITFKVGGKDFAIVDASGAMAVVTSTTLTADQAKELRVWIKDTFMGVAK